MEALTKQQIFDKALNGVRQQGGPSNNGVGVVSAKGACAYRGTAGTKCGIGHLIPDDHYLPRFDSANNSGVRRLLRGDLFRAALAAGGVVEPDIDFLEHIQRAHDGSSHQDQFMPAFELEMRGLAARYDLAYTA
jgi:hypothetical protein